MIFIFLFKFFGSGKFKQVGYLRCKGMKNLRELRTWKIKEDVFVGVLPAEVESLTIFKAVKTGTLNLFFSVFDMS